MADQQRPEWVEAIVNGLNNRRKPIPSPIFDGTTDVRKFLHTFGEVAEANHWDDDERSLQLKLALRGTAAECAQGETTEEIAESLVNRFQLTREEARRELRNLKLKAGQDIHLFGNLVMKLVRMAEPDLDQDALDDRACAELVDAIGDRLLTREFRLQGPINFADAIRRIQQYNSDMRISRLHRVGIEEDEDTRSQERDAKIKQLDKEMKELKASVDKGQTDVANAQKALEAKLDGFIQQITQKLSELPGRNWQPHRGQHNSQQPCRQQRQWTPTRVCGNCHCSGHVKAECRVAARPSQQWAGERRTCYNCGGEGHISRNCTAQRRNQPALNMQGPE